MSRWAVRVSQDVFNQVRRDKDDDGIVQRNRLGEKRRGYLDVDYLDAGPRRRHHILVTTMISGRHALATIEQTIAQARGEEGSPRRGPESGGGSGRAAAGGADGRLSRVGAATSSTR